MLHHRKSGWCQKQATSPHRSDWSNLYPLYTGAATFVPPLCDHKTGQVAVEGTAKEAERLLALVVQEWHRGRSDLAMDAMKFWAYSRRSVAQRRQKAHASPSEAVVAEWMHRARRPPRCLFCYSNFGDSRKAQWSCCSSYTETELSNISPISVQQKQMEFTLREPYMLPFLHS